MIKFIREFKAFAVRGNVVDLAIAVVIGGAFGKIVNALVEDIITPSIGILMGGIDLTHYTFKVGSATITYGEFFQSIIDFLIVAFVIFIVVKTLNRFNKKEDEKKEQKPESEEILLLREIRDSLKRK